jgi:hypothetical protein
MISEKKGYSERTMKDWERFLMKRSSESTMKDQERVLMKHSSESTKIHLVPHEVVKLIATPDEVMLSVEH